MEKLFYMSIYFQFSIFETTDSYYHGKNFRFKEIAIKHPAP